MYSSVEESKLDVGQQVWPCEFCLTENKVCIDDEEKPKTDAVNYIVEAAA